jgi:carboxypeptidase Taq
LWENHVGRSWDFWRLHFAELQAYFPEQLKGVDEAAFYRAVNRVQPSLIRVPADELTYDFHVMLRVELRFQSSLTPSIQKEERKTSSLMTK